MTMLTAGHHAPALRYHKLPIPCMVSAIIRRACRVPWAIPRHAPRQLAGAATFNLTTRLLLQKRPTAVVRREFHWQLLELIVVSVF